MEEILLRYLSLCLPTNGIIEWVIPVLDNIYNQDANQEEWELIITDNGNNEEFYRIMQDYVSQHKNLVYKKTEAYLFDNQIEALKLSSGEYLKFINHRSILEQGAIQWMIDIVRHNIDEKPVIYLSDGTLGYTDPLVCSNFDGFVRGLRELASWTTGVGVWKSDFEKIPKDWVYNRISPHSDVLFFERNKGKYIIDDKVWCHDIDTGHTKKGKYDLYRAFAVEEISITLGLLNDRSITASTFKTVVKGYEKCVANFYYMFNLLKEPCSYRLDSFDESMGIFLNKNRVLMKAYYLYIRHTLAKPFKAWRT